jgi:hypothetical protein
MDISQHFLQDGGPTWGQLQFQQQVEIEVATLDAKTARPTRWCPAFASISLAPDLPVAAWK